MLSAGERPQPPLNAKAAVDASRTAVTKSSLSHHKAVAMRADTSKAEDIQHIWIVTGPAGCGKSTIGRALEKKLGLPFLEGDDFHSQSNREKMGNGIPLTDEDRWDWLISLRKAAIDALSPSQANNYHPPSGVVVACSALKQKYRDVMRVAAYGTPSVQIHFVYLKLAEDVLIQRVTQRESHYMKSGMVQSQLQALEEPQGEWDALTVNADGPREQVQQAVLDLVSQKLAEYQ
ncbi:gluconokinase [Aspergillus clavatus NRRL 1]|uniref:Gluconokinase n=1 Tax=Aspergillus clavatus (strain ATCC 1007 / CBS 513.65 / DSM 816 / NCTC 3887 / NRRL 1 / QM 1276 / 107) TaxID=344612 RepID=A1CIC9_ASPCL|nr:thermoresistant gluconokinase family protein [Aspergillus clavatus NRRL 1]EAW10634.1 thermoresistant gluconokinase family protein [Aspergillus clavatus NRRL 1]